MKKLLLLLFPILSIAQVGINTTNPTATLDVNGTARVRTLQNGTVEVDNTGNLSVSPYKVIALCNFMTGGVMTQQHNVASIVQMTAGVFRVTFTTPMIGNAYVVSALSNNRYCMVNNLTSSSFELSISSTAGLYNVQFIVFDIL